MSTRAIVTSRPDLACYVCQRTLLRGEQPELFLADGETRTVCELCAPRAASEGWPRADEQDAIVQAPLPSRRGRGLFGRLRAAGWGPAPEDAGDASAAEESSVAAARSRPFDLEGPATGEAAQGQEAQVELTPAEAALARAVEAFNAGEYPRRVASLTRSLGSPEASVRLDEDLRLVSIVVAWELCWYQYRVDLDEEPAQAAAFAQGTELDELPREERLANAVADERGALALIATGA